MKIVNHLGGNLISMIHQQALNIAQDQDQDQP